MFALITTLSTNLLRTYIIYRFMRLFFWTDIEEKKKERACYVLFFILTAGVHLIFCSPGMSVITNIVLIFLITVCYEGALKKKIFVTLLVMDAANCTFMDIVHFGNFYLTFITLQQLYDVIEVICLNFLSKVSNTVSRSFFPF